MIENFTIELINNLVEQTLLTLSKKITDKQKYEKNLKRYLEVSYRKYNKIKTILHNDAPKDFNDLYVPLTISHQNEKYRVDNNLEFLNKYKKLIIVGTPGSGKSTLLKKIFLESIDITHRVPVFIELRKIPKDYDIDVIDLLKLEDLSILENDSIMNLFNSGNLLIMLDGLDEIPLRRKERTLELLNTLSQVEGNEIVTSTRNGMDSQYLINYSVFELNKFNKDEIYYFIKKNAKDTKIVNNVYNQIKGKNNLDELLSNPIFLYVYISLLNTHSIDISLKRTSFYRRMIDILFSQHDAITKIGFIRERSTNLNQSEFERILSYISFTAYFKNMYEFSKDELYNIFDKIKNDNPIFRKIENNNLLFDLTVSLGIIIENEGMYSFIHITFVEYFCALFIHNLTNENKYRLYSKLFDDYQKRLDNLSSSMYINLYELDKYTFFKYLYINQINELLESTYKMKESTESFLKYYHIDYRLALMNDFFKYLYGQSYINKLRNNGLIYFIDVLEEQKELVLENVENNSFIDDLLKNDDV